MSDSDQSKAGKLKAAAPFILFTVFLDMLSIGIIIPVFAPLIRHFTVSGTVSEAGLWVGIFGSAWGLAQFLFSPVQGSMSDSIGRRPVVLASNLGTGLDFLFMAVAPNLWWLLVGRIISGMTSASISTAYAYMSDVTEPAKRAKVFGLMGAAFGMGFIVGPSLGGILGGGLHWQFLTDHGLGFLNFSGGPRLPFFVASALSIVNFIYGFFVLPESLPKDRRKPFSFRAANPIAAIRFLSRSSEVLRLAVMYLLLMFAQSVFPTTMVLYSAYRFGWGPSQVGIMLAFVGILSAVVQAGLTGVIVKALGELKTMFLGLGAGLVAFTWYAFAPQWQVFVLAMPVGALWGLTMPNIQALMTSKVDPKEQGMLQGSNMSLASMATIFAPIAFGSILSAVTRGGVPRELSGAAFLLAALCLLLALLLGLGVHSSLKVAPAYDGAEPPAH